MISSAALVALTACGGGGAGSTIGSGTSTYAVLAADALNFDLNRALGVSPSLPAAGSADYGGSMVVAEDLYNGGSAYINGDILVDIDPISASGYVGEVSLTADFTAGGGAMVTGTVVNFYGTTIDTVTGALTGSTGAMIGDALTLTGGTYPDASPGGPTMDVAGTLDGKTAGGSLIFEFFGPSGSAILGESLAAGGMTLDAVNTDAKLTSR